MIILNGGEIEHHIKFNHSSGEFNELTIQYGKFMSVIVTVLIELIDMSLDFDEILTQGDQLGLLYYQVHNPFNLLVLQQETVLYDLVFC